MTASTATDRIDGAPIRAFAAIEVTIVYMSCEGKSERTTTITLTGTLRRENIVIAVDVGRIVQINVGDALGNPAYQGALWTRLTDDFYEILMD